MNRSRSGLIVALAATLGSCHDKAPAPAAPPPPTAAPTAAPTVLGGSTVESATFDPKLQVDLKASTKTATGLYYRDIVVGTGPVAANDKTVSVGYIGWLVNGTEFEESPETAPISFQLGAHRVIAGWDEGLVGMHVGGKRQLIIPSDLAYGPNGSGKIPPNAILIFNVELKDAQ